MMSYKTIEGHSAVLPCVGLEPKTPGRRTVIWVHSRGKASLYASDGSLHAPVQALLNGGVNVIGVDLLLQGEFLSDRQSAVRQRWLEGEEGFCGWTYCYNLPLVARRVHDLLAVVETRKRRGESVELVAFGPAAAWAAAAVVQSRGAISRAALDTQGFRFASVRDVYGANFMPGAVKYGDLPGLLALAAPTPVWLAGEGTQPPPIVAAAYQAAGESSRLTLSEPDSDSARAVQWILSRDGG